MSEPRRLSEILGPTLARLATTEQARAYGAWARAAGDQVAGDAHPRHFARGVLTVECTSSVWAQELTYLGGQLLARMDQVSPGHPVRRFRFVVASGPSTCGDDGPPSRGRVRPASPAAAEIGEGDSRPRRPEPAQHDAGASRPAPREPAERDGACPSGAGVRDERLRAAIEAAARATPAGRPGAPGASPRQPSGASPGEG